MGELVQHERLPEPSWYLPPNEFEAQYHTQVTNSNLVELVGLELPMTNSNPVELVGFELPGLLRSRGDSGRTLAGF